MFQIQFRMSASGINTFLHRALVKWWWILFLFRVIGYLLSQSCLGFRVDTCVRFLPVQVWNGLSRRPRGCKTTNRDLLNQTQSFAITSLLKMCTWWARLTNLPLVWLMRRRLAREAKKFFVYKRIFSKLMSMVMYILFIKTRIVSIQKTRF